MKREKITVQKRTTKGKNVKKLRRDGIMPANVYGRDIESQSVQLPLKEFIQLYKKVHETGLVDLELDKDSYPVLIHNVQWDRIALIPLHADFFKVNLKEKITSNIPITAVGEPIAVKDKLGVLMTLLAELEVEALPTDLPEKIEVNVENLAQVGDQITVESINLGSQVKIINEPSQVIFKIDELVAKETEEEVKAEEAAVEAATEAESAAEGTESEKSEEKPSESAEGEKPKEEKSEESK